MAMAGLTLAAAGYQAYASHESGKAQRKIANRNADLLDRSADDALARGGEEALAVRRRGRQLVGDQRAAAAAQGLDVNQGAAADLQEQAATFAAQDEATVRKNAWREAYGIRSQAGNQRMQGRYAQRTGTNNAIGTGLEGIGKSYAYWQADQSPRMR